MYWDEHKRDSFLSSCRTGDPPDDGDVKYMTKESFVIFNYALREFVCSRVGPEGSTHVGSIRLRVDDSIEDDKDWSVPATALPGSAEEELRLPFHDIIVLFDNSYSWFRPKFIRWEGAQCDEGGVCAAYLVLTTCDWAQI